MQEAFDWGVCHVVNTLQFDVRASDTKRLGVGGMLTEFGAETQDADGLKVSDLGISFYSVGKCRQCWSGSGVCSSWGVGDGDGNGGRCSTLP